MFYLKKLLSALVLPPFGLILLGFFGLWLARRHPRTGRSIAALALLALTALSLPPVADALMHSLETYPALSASWGQSASSDHKISDASPSSDHKPSNTPTLTANVTKSSDPKSSGPKSFSDAKPSSDQRPSAPAPADPKRSPNLRPQAIVILGGGNYPAAPEYGGDTVSHYTLERVRYGVHLQRRSGLPILVTGGAPFGGRPEGETMKEAIERDFHGQVKWVEAASRDTAENAAMSAAMLKAAGITRIALVSHGWHLPRAVELFEHQGLEVLPAPTSFATHAPSLFAQALPSASALEKSYMALHEWLGILVQRMTMKMGN